MENDRPSKTVDLRDGFSYAGDFTIGSKHRLYDIHSAGLLGGVGDTLIWRSQHGDVQGEVIEAGWEDCPLPTRWVYVVMTRG